MQSILRSPALTTLIFVVIFALLSGGGPAMLALPVFGPMVFLGSMLVNWIIK